MRPPFVVHTTRRGLLVGSTATGIAVAAAAVAGHAVYEGSLPGRPFLQAALGLDGRDGTIPDVAPGPVVEGSFVSRARGGTQVGWALLLPPGVRRPDGLRLVVALHGYGETHRDLTGPEFGLDRFLAADTAHRPPYAIATADGGTSYWHPHEGDDAGAMVVDELLPLVAAQGVDVSRPIGLLGWSMGGYGALHLAQLLGPARTAAVSAVSPALWTDAADAPGHGFASPAEYERFTAFGHQDDLASIPVRIDCGTGDPFYPAVRAYARGLPADTHTTLHYARGAHDPGYWRRVLPADLAFLGRHLGPTS